MTAHCLVMSESATSGMDRSIVFTSKGIGRNLVLDKREGGSRAEESDGPHRPHRLCEGGFGIDHVTPPVLEFWGHYIRCLFLIDTRILYALLSK